MKRITPAYMMPTKRLLFESDDSASIANAATQHLQEREHRDGREEEQVLADEREAAGEQDLHDEQQDARAAR